MLESRVRAQLLELAVDEQLQCGLEPKQLVAELHLVGVLCPMYGGKSVLELVFTGVLEVL